jgi:hypothetical protein
MRTLFLSLVIFLSVSAANGASLLQSTGCGPESCNGLDDDCDGLVDEDFPADGVRLAVARDESDPAAVNLEWTGGQPAFGVFASTDAASLFSPANLRGETLDHMWQATTPPGNLFFFGIETPCALDCPERCDGVDNDCDGQVDEAGSEAYCQFPNTLAECVDSACRCANNFAECDGDPANGCEFDVCQGEGRCESVERPDGTRITPVQVASWFDTEARERYVNIESIRRLAIPDMACGSTASWDTSNQAQGCLFTDGTDHTNLPGSSGFAVIEAHHNRGLDLALNTNGDGVRPRNRFGQPVDMNGKIVLLSIGFSGCRDLMFSGEITNDEGHPGKEGDINQLNPQDQGALSFLSRAGSDDMTDGSYGPPCTGDANCGGAAGSCLPEGRCVNPGLQGGSRLNPDLAIVNGCTGGQTYGRWINGYKWLLHQQQMISAGGNHTCALHRREPPGVGDNEVRCWGDNAYGQTDVPPLTDPLTVSAGRDFNCALDSDGVVCWGRNDFGQAPSRVQTAGLVNPRMVSAGAEHACALDDTGVVCWGHNNFGQAPPQAMLPSLTNPFMVSAGGFHTCALDDTGVVCWGRDDDNQMSDAPDDLDNPIAVSAGGFHTCTLDDSGVFCWGREEENQSTVPALSMPTAISAGNLHTCAVHDDGVECWGAPGAPELDVPADLTGPVVVSAGGSHSCATSLGSQLGSYCAEENLDGGQSCTLDTDCDDRNTGDDSGSCVSCAPGQATVYCWGNNGDFQVTGEGCQGAPSTLETFEADYRSTWLRAFDRLESKDHGAPLGAYSKEQVQVALVLTDGQSHKYWDPCFKRNSFPAHGIVVRDNLRTLLGYLQEQFVNLKLAYVTSWVAGAYNEEISSQEPWAHEGGWGIKWLIRDQINDVAGATVDDIPWVSWAPYLWSDGAGYIAPGGETSVTRSDGVYCVGDRGDANTGSTVVNYSDFRDGQHLTDEGMARYVDRLLYHFRNDPTSHPWFTSDGMAVDGGAYDPVDCQICRDETDVVALLQAENPAAFDSGEHMCTATPEGDACMFEVGDSVTRTVNFGSGGSYGFHLFWTEEIGVGAEAELLVDGQLLATFSQPGDSSFYTDGNPNPETTGQMREERIFVTVGPGNHTVKLVASVSPFKVDLIKIYK